MSMFTSTRWAARQTVRAIVEFKGLFLMALSLAGLALTIPFFLATLAWSLSAQVFNVPTQAEVTRLCRPQRGRAVREGSG